MLKRYQVLLDDWQEEYIRRSAARFDFSFSQVVRILISEGILSILFSLEPKKKIGITARELTQMKKKILNHRTSAEERHQIISKIYFEARKAAEYKINQV